MCPSGQKQLRVSLTLYLVFQSQLSSWVPLSSISPNDRLQDGIHFQMVASWIHGPWLALGGLGVCETTTLQRFYAIVFREIVQTLIRLIPTMI